MKNKLFLVIIGALLLLSACNGAAIKLTNPIKTCKMVDVPYQTTEEYQVPFKYEVVSATKSTTLHGFDVWAVGEVAVRNVDSETGSFIVAQKFTTLNRPSQSFSSTQYIMSGETAIFHQEYDITMGEDFNIDYSIVPPEKTLTRTVTKYRSEEQCE